MYSMGALYLPLKARAMICIQLWSYAFMRRLGKKKDLIELAHISDYTIRKLNRGENVSYTHLDVYKRQEYGA